MRLGMEAMEGVRSRAARPPAGGKAVLAMKEPDEMTRDPKERKPEATGPETDGDGEALSETWSQDAQDELEDFIEEQGIYIRQ